MINYKNFEINFLSQINTDFVDFACMEFVGPSHNKSTPIRENPYAMDTSQSVDHQRSAFVESAFRDVRVVVNDILSKANFVNDHSASPIALSANTSQDMQNPEFNSSLPPELMGFSPLAVVPKSVGICCIILLVICMLIWYVTITRIRHAFLETASV